MSNAKGNGTVEKVTGAVKEKVGEITGNTKLQTEGLVEKVGGAAKEVAEDAKGAVEGVKKGVKNLLDKEEK